MTSSVKTERDILTMQHCNFNNRRLGSLDEDLDAKVQIREREPSRVHHSLSSILSSPTECDQITHRGIDAVVVFSSRLLVVTDTLRFIDGVSPTTIQ